MEESWVALRALNIVMVQSWPPYGLYTLEHQLCNASPRPPDASCKDMQSRK